MTELPSGSLASSSGDTDAGIAAYGSGTEVAIDHTVVASVHSDKYAARLDRLRRFIDREKRRFSEEDRRIGIDAATKHEMEAIGRTPLCAVRKRLFRLGLL